MTYFSDDEINEFKNKIDELQYEIFELKQKIRFSKENELKEFLNELYNGIKIELDKKNSRFDVDEYNKLSKENILNNLKIYIENFCKDNKMLL